MFVYVSVNSDIFCFLDLFHQLIDGGGSQTRLLDASNRFYTLIPHDFGMKKPPLLDNKDVVKVTDITVVIFYMITLISLIF